MHCRNGKQLKDRPSWNAKTESNEQLSSEVKQEGKNVEPFASASGFSQANAPRCAVKWWTRPSCPDWPPSHHSSCWPWLDEPLSVSRSPGPRWPSRPLRPFDDVWPPRALHFWPVGLDPRLSQRRRQRRRLRVRRAPTCADRRHDETSGKRERRPFLLHFVMMG